MPISEQKDIFLTKDKYGKNSIDYLYSMENNNEVTKILYNLIDFGGDKAQEALQKASDEKLNQIRKYGEQVQGKLERTDNVVLAIDDFR